MERAVSSTAGWESTAGQGKLDLALMFLALLAYFTYLLSAMPADDVMPYIQRLQSDHFDWDVGHIWIEPIALLGWRLIAGSVKMMSYLEAINVFCTALGLTIFFHTLRELNIGRLRAVLCVFFVAVSFNVLSLAPTGHIKFMVMPPLALATHYALMWEFAINRNDAAGTYRSGLRAGLWFGVAANFLVSVLPMAPWIGLFAFWRMRHLGWRESLRRCMPFINALFIAGAGLLFAAYVVARVSETTHLGFVGFVLASLGEKVSQHPGFFGWKEIPARFVYSVIYNFVFMPDLGGLGRAMLWGALPEPAAYALRIARDLCVGGLTAAALLLLMANGIGRARRAGGLVFPFAMIIGAACFAIYQNVNDPEHWFQFTMPFAVLAAFVSTRWLAILCFGIWLPVMALVNLGTYGVPKARFAFTERQEALRSAIGDGLYIGYAEYPGEPDTSLIPLRGVERVSVDQLHFSTKSAEETFTLLCARIDRALERHGKVLVFRVLDAGDWRGPVLALQGNGLSKPEFARRLEARYEIGPTQEVGGFPAKEIIALKRGAGN